MRPTAFVPRLSLLSLLACSLGCGSAPPPPTAAPVRIDAQRLLLDSVAVRVPSLQPPHESSGDLQREASAARGTERLAIMRRLAVAHVAEAVREPEPRRARRSFRSATRIARDVGRRTHDAWTGAEMHFVQVLAAWLGGNGRDAERLASAFVERRARDAGELMVFAWMIRGEVALAAQRWEQAATAYRFVLGQLDHPLYAFGLWRTAHCYRGLGRVQDAQQALREADAIGDRRNVHASARQVADAARSELGLPARSAVRDGPEH